LWKMGLGLLATAVAVVGGLVAISLGVSSSSKIESSTENTDTLVSASALRSVDWLEPRGINIVDLVGAVPEDYLKGAIVSYGGFGIVRYVGGSRINDRVVITTTTYPRHVGDPNTGWHGTMFGCLGHAAFIDGLGSVSPPAKVHIYLPDGSEITRQVDSYDYNPSGQIKPILNPRQSEQQGKDRYELKTFQTPRFDVDGAFLLPGNMGCRFVMSHKNYSQLTVVYSLQVQRTITIQVMGSENFSFPVYTGPGNAGRFSRLRDRLNGFCGNAAALSQVDADFTMSIPSGANFFVMNFPPTPVDPYAPWLENDNAGRPSGGTYRIRSDRGLSVDHVVAMGLPLFGHWVDLDVAPADVFLPYSQVPTTLSGLEYMVPAGVSYDACMLDASCSEAKLRELCNTRTPSQVVYLKVQPLWGQSCPLPVRMPGANWSPGLLAAGVFTHSGLTPYRDMPANTLASTGTYTIFLPLMTKAPPNLCEIQSGLETLACDPRGGLGWFTEDGRMVDYLWCK
jgi:hypothetical protein